MLDARVIAEESPGLPGASVRLMQVRAAVNHEGLTGEAARERRACGFYLIHNGPG